MNPSSCSRRFQLLVDKIRSAVNCWQTAEMNEARIPVLRLPSPGNAELCKHYSGTVFENSIDLMTNRFSLRWKSRVAPSFTHGYSVRIIALPF
jgi:hypothetical protein